MQNPIFLLVYLYTKKFIIFYFVLINSGGKVCLLVEHLPEKGERRDRGGGEVDGEMID